MKGIFGFGMLIDFVLIVVLIFFIIAILVWFLGLKLPF